MVETSLRMTRNLSARRTGVDHERISKPYYKRGFVRYRSSFLELHKKYVPLLSITYGDDSLALAIPGKVVTVHRP